MLFKSKGKKKKKDSHSVPSHCSQTDKLEGNKQCDKHLLVADAGCCGMVSFKNLIGFGNGAARTEETCQLHVPVRPIWMWCLWGW